MDVLTLAVPVDDRDHVLGAARAPVTLVEYGDYECPQCGVVHPMLAELRARSGERLRFAYRHFPLVTYHPHAMLAAEAAESAGAQGQFWAMHDMLYAHQQSLAGRDLLAYASTLGLDVARFERDVLDHRYQARVQDDYRGGARAGVKATPTLFINGVVYPGPRELDPLLAAVAAAAESPRPGRS